MTVGDLKQILASLPDNYSVRIDAQNDSPVMIRSVSLETHAICLREHMLTIHRVVDTITAYDGSEYVLAVETVKFPTILQMPSPIQSQLRASVKRLSSPDDAA